MAHQSARGMIDAVAGIDDDSDGLYRVQRGKGGATKFGVAWRVDQIDVDVTAIN